jgi:hypothetical protein
VYYVGYVHSPILTVEAPGIRSVCCAVTTVHTLSACTLNPRLPATSIADETASSSVRPERDNSQGEPNEYLSSLNLTLPTFYQLCFGIKMNIRSNKIIFIPYHVSSAVLMIDNKERMKDKEMKNH